MLVLAEPVQPLTIPGGEPHLDVVQAAVVPGGHVPPLRRPAKVRRRFGQQFGTVGGAEEAKPAAGRDLRGQPAVDHPGQAERAIGPRSRGRRGGEQRARQVVTYLRPDRSAHPKTVRPPGLDAQRLVAAPPLDGRPIVIEDAHAAGTSQNLVTEPRRVGPGPVYESIRESIFEPYVPGW